MGADSPHDVPRRPGPGDGRGAGRGRTAPGPEGHDEADLATEPADDRSTEPGDNSLDGYQPL